MEKNRKVEVDIARGIGILLMVFGHLHVSEFLNKYIYAFHMPLFFICSGYVYRLTDTRTLVKKRLFTLLFPYLVFGLTYWIINAIKILILHEDYSQLLSTITSFLFFPTDGLAIENSLWFLPTMFFTVVIYNFLNKNISKKTVLLISILLLSAIGFITASYISVKIPFGFDRVFIGLLFFHFGRLCNDYSLLEKAKEKTKENKVVAILLLALLCFIVYLSISYNNPINMRLSRWGIAPLSTFNAILASFIILFISMLWISKMPTFCITEFLYRVSLYSMVFVCINHPIIYLSGFIIRQGFSSKIYQYSLTYLFSILIMYIISILIFKTRLRIVFGKKTSYEK